MKFKPKIYGSFLNPQNLSPQFLNGNVIWDPISYKKYVCQRIHFLRKISMPHALLSLIDFTSHYHVWLFHVIAKFWILIKSTSDILNLNGPHRSRALEVWDNILLHICHFSFYLTVWLENINNKFIIMNKKKEHVTVTITKIQ